MATITKEQLTKAVAIQNTIIARSAILDEHTKQALLTYSKQIQALLDNTGKLNAYQLTTLSNELCIYWNERIGIDTEMFWQQLKMAGINIQRKEPLRFALAKGRFRNVEQGIDARNVWSDLKQSSFIQEAYSVADQQAIDQIIATDENKRFEILKKCLLKKAIPQTQYLKFGECMAYFGRCHLFDKYFSPQQVDELWSIWKNFESK